MALLMMMGCQFEPNEVVGTNDVQRLLDVRRVATHVNISFVNIEYPKTPHIETNTNTSAWYLQHYKVGQNYEQ